MQPLRNASRLLLAALMAVSLGCQSDSPTEPSSAPQATPKPPVPVTTFNVSVTASPTELSADNASTSTVTVEVRRSDNGQPPPDLTEVTLTTNLGSFGSAGGPQTIDLPLVNGRAQAVLVAGTEAGTATVRAQLSTSAGAANVRIGAPATFFISSISPGVGSPQGGEEVTILGGGFQEPVRVTFNNAAAIVRSVTPTRIRVVTPSAIAAGVQVGAGEAEPVNVSVTVNVNEVGQVSDVLAQGFIYASGGGGPIQPTVFTVTPGSGSNDGGTRVTIVGEGFQSPVQVLFGTGTTGSFNGVEATVESVTSTRIVAITPAARGFGQNNVNQLVDVQVRNVNSGFTTISTDIFKYGSEVLITAMGPGSGSYTGGTRVTLTGQGFDEPVAVTLGDDPAIAQQVVSVTGTQIVFITSGVPIAECPEDGIISAEGVSVVNTETGDGDEADLTFNYIVPLPVIFQVNPISGNVNSNTTISGRSFADNVQVIFGDANSGSSAFINSNSASSISVRVPNPPQGFSFIQEPCDTDGDGNPGGRRNAPTPISVTVRNLDGTGCDVTLSNAFTLNPPNTACTGDNTAPPPAPAACNDGFDNDSDGFIDAADPQCTGPTDPSESS
jgi:hypothetical protein